MQQSEEEDLLNKIKSTNSSDDKNSLGNVLKECTKTISEFHPLILSGISLVGMIYYFVYFGVKLEYFPDLGGADVAYVGVSFFFISAFISLSIILPCLFYPGYHKKDIGWIIFFWIFFASSLCINLYGSIKHYSCK